ncbi:MAG: ABC-F family ATP-binding cassette domain-containing protein [Bacteroidales bacterium]|jgi:ATP-binding cassette subfamily F protein uup|nr:ABC-F family ATP-binding cassette domain-containing protein [Bacteroidales bacterium]
MVSYLQAENILRRIGENLLFENIFLNINKGDKIAIIAVNGAGKSSLLDILSGRENPDGGSVSLKRGLKISYLLQSPILNEENKIIDELFCTESDLTSVIRDYEESIFSGNEKVVQVMVQRMDDLKAWDYEIAVKQILFKLKLTDLNAIIGTLSGGQKKRVALAKVLVENADLLMLDEPTNHLDLDMIEWLEEYFIKSGKTLIMVTHDRYFLDRVCNVILELSENELVRYDGNYEYFLEKKQLKEVSDQSNTEKAKNLFKSELDWMRRMPKARRHKAKSRIESFYDLKERAAKRPEEKSININVNASRMGKKILVLKNLTKSYDDKILLKDFSYTFNRFEKAGLVGRNGTGKTTLLNIITGLDSPDTGTVDRGETVVFGYYRQQRIEFDDEMTVIDAVKNISESVVIKDGNVLSISQFMNYFLFPPQKHYTLIKKLSGGEKRRLYLLTVLMRNPNFLILDEPTNDLDILTLNVLEDYLAGFRGCVIVVSHDRYFMDKVVDHIFEYKGDGFIKDFPGNYSQFREKQSEDARESVIVRTSKIKDSASLPGIPVKKEKKPGMTFKEKKEFETLSIEIEILESEKKLIEEKISDGTLNSEALYEQSKRHGEIVEMLNPRELRWLELSEK